MKAFFAFGLLILIAFFGSRFIFKRKKILQPWNYLLLSGFIYIFLGILLGKHVLNVLSARVLSGLHPLVGFGLGWIGFVFGFQLEIKYLRRFPQKFVSLSVSQFLVVFFVVTSGLLVVLKLIFPAQPRFFIYGLAVSWGLLGSLNSPSLLNLASSTIPSKGNYYYLARFLASTSGFWSISGLVFIFSFWHFPLFLHNVLVSGLIIIFSLITFAFLLGYVFYLLTKKKILEQDLFVFLLSFVFFASGASIYFNLPSLFVCMLMGIIFTNLTRVQEKIYPLLFASEKPIYIIFLILIGALWNLNFDYRIVLLTGLLFILKLAAFSLSLPPLRAALNFPFKLPVRFGLCFLSPGGIAVALAISVKLAYSLPLADVFISVALLFIVISEFFSPWLLRESLLKIEEEK